MQRADLSPADRRRFRTGRDSLDLTHTGGAGEAARWEIVHTAADLGFWLAVILELPTPLPAADEDLPPFRALRTAVTNAARGLAAGDPVRADDAAAINAAALVPPLVPALLAGGAGGRPYPPDAAPPRPTVPAALSTLARDAIDVLGGPLAGRIRICAGENCGLLFVDTSRPGSRRWCSMQRCGNLTKVRRHRA